MGACFSRKKGMPRAPPGADGVRADGRRGPPPEPEAPQEETVKEVLSETPRPKAPRSSRDQKEVLARVDRDISGVDATDDRSEAASAVCSVQSEAFSVSTELTGEPERPPPSETPVKFQRKRSSSSGEILLRRPDGMTTTAPQFASVGCRSGRSSISSAKRRVDGGGAGRPSSLREASSASASASASAARNRNPCVAGRVLRRDPGERSGRRSVSPAKKHTGGGQCRSVSASRASPRRALGVGAVEGGGFGSRRIRMVRDVVENDVGGSGAGEATEGTESLNNPLVSLECFIFL